MKDTTTDARLVFQVFNEIGIINQLVSTRLAKALAPHLGISEFGVLNHLVRVGDGTSPSRLARIFQITKPSMTAILAKLEAKGFITLAPAPQDRRQKLVTITDAGRKARTVGVESTTPLAAELLAHFDVSEIAALRPALQALREYLDAARNDVDRLNR